MYHCTNATKELVIVMKIRCPAFNVIVVHSFAWTSGPARSFIQIENCWPAIGLLLTSNRVIVADQQHLHWHAIWLLLTVHPRWDGWDDEMDESTFAWMRVWYVWSDVMPTAGLLVIVVFACSSFGCKSPPRHDILCHHGLAYDEPCGRALWQGPPHHCKVEGRWLLFVSASGVPSIPCGTAWQSPWQDSAVVPLVVRKELQGSYPCDVERSGEVTGHGVSERRRVWVLESMESYLGWFLLHLLVVCVCVCQLWVAVVFQVQPVFLHW